MEDFIGFGIKNDVESNSKGEIIGGKYHLLINKGIWDKLWEDADKKGLLFPKNKEDDIVPMTFNTKGIFKIKYKIPEGESLAKFMARRVWAIKGVTYNFDEVNTKEQKDCEDKRKQEEICPDCNMPIKIRNPSGYCDHLYYPENKKPRDFQLTKEDNFETFMAYVGRKVESAIKTDNAETMRKVPEVLKQIYYTAFIPDKLGALRAVYEAGNKRGYAVGRADGYKAGCSLAFYHDQLCKPVPETDILSNAKPDGKRYHHGHILHNSSTCKACLRIARAEAYENEITEWCVTHKAETQRLIDVAKAMQARDKLNSDIRGIQLFAREIHRMIRAFVNTTHYSIREYYPLIEFDKQMKKKYQIEEVES